MAAPELSMQFSIVWGEKSALAASEWNAEVQTYL
jgi:hypothetical protein